MVDSSLTITGQLCHLIWCRWSIREPLVISSNVSLETQFWMNDDHTHLDSLDLVVEILHLKLNVVF